MNTERRKKLDEVLSDMEAIVESLEAIKDAEQTAFDAMPESFQSGEKGELATSWIEALETAAGTISDEVDNLRGVS